ncbi:crossover junction endodeoxyribonuclease RuvC [uncultured Microbacterium sp.]|uniref:crossover junction endodeoxyribonuclease RuvC n=1 Tax=uncultured Microbacterium sp. TaxID=191216 RepID=UPI002608EF17|nr:crossover junction endodeoxyribonuclease RuvC [uncultured Microbacterium sp.]
MSIPILSHETVQTPPTNIYVGLDLSLTSTGIAIIHGDQITTRRITSKGKQGATTAEQVDRLGKLVENIAHEVPWTDHARIAVEGPSYGSTGTAAHILGGFWWMVRHRLATLDLDVVVVPPGTVKKYATGRGNAGKDEVLAAVIRRYSHVDVSGNDEADALVLAAIRARLDGHPIDPDLSRTHFATLDQAVSA